MKLKSGAKINIGLKVLNRRSDGYHNILTIFQELNFGDDLEVIKSDNGCEFSSNVSWLKNDKSNLCVSAWIKMRDSFSKLRGVKIRLKKRIPKGSGLGGGSSNAAGVIKCLNSIYSLNMTHKKMENVAADLGADVAFFIQGGTQIGKGIGEDLKTLSSPPSGTVLLVFPNIHINTAQAFGLLKNKLEDINESPNFASFFQENSFPEEIFKNDFEKVIFPAYPEIGRIKKTLIELGAVFAGLSGSGSTVYGIFNDVSSAVSAESQFKSTYHTIVTSPANS